MNRLFCIEISGYTIPCLNRYLFDIWGTPTPIVRIVNSANFMHRYSASIVLLGQITRILGLIHTGHSFEALMMDGFSVLIVDTSMASLSRQEYARETFSCSRFSRCTYGRDQSSERSETFTTSPLSLIVAVSKCGKVTKSSNRDMLKPSGQFRASCKYALTSHEKSISCISLYKTVRETFFMSVWYASIRSPTSRWLRFWWFV